MNSDHPMNQRPRACSRCSSWISSRVSRLPAHRLRASFAATPFFSTGADKVILPDINGRELGGGDDFGGCSNSGRPSRGGEATQQLLQPAQELRKQGGWLRGFPPAPDRSLNGIALRLSALVLSQAL
jgi:hypothetical protein